MPAGTPENERLRLSSWKEIAAHLGRDVRTVLRWHKGRGLPVYRVPGGKGHSIFAYADELDQWMRSGASALGPPAPARRRSGWTLALAAMAAVAPLAAAVGISSGGRHGVPASVELAGRELVARDESRRELWSVPLLEEGRPAILCRRGVQIADLDGDGKPEVVASVRLTGERITREVLYCFGHDGRLRWRQSLDDRLVFTSGEYGPPWRAEDLLIFGAGPVKRIAWVTSHDTWWPAVLVTLDANGRIQGRFVNSGWLRCVEYSADGRYLLVTGVSNARDGAVLAALKPDDVTGASPEDWQSPYACRGCPLGRPEHYFVFPRSEASRAAARPLLSPCVEIGANGSLLIRAPQDVDGAREAIFELSSSLELRRASLSDLYWEWHRRLESEGRLAHRADACPERSRLRVEAWNAQQSWTELKAAAANAAGGPATP